MTLNSRVASQEVKEHLQPSFLSFFGSADFQTPETISLTLGQGNAIDALKLAFSDACADQHVFLSCSGGYDDKPLIQALVDRAITDEFRRHLGDWVYLANPHDRLRPHLVRLEPGDGPEFIDAVSGFATASAIADATTAEQILQRFGEAPSLKAYLSWLALDPESQQSLMKPALLVGHRKDARPPVVHCYRLDERRLFGDIAYETQAGSVMTHHHLLQPGLLHQANGGVLVVKADQLLDNLDVWQRLKAVIDSGWLDWLPASNQLVSSPFSPDPVPLNLKLIVVGDRLSLAELSDLDPEFGEYFAIASDINPFYYIKSPQQLANYCLFLDLLAAREGLLPLSQGAKLALCRHSSRLAEDNQRVLLLGKELSNLIAQASAVADAETAITLAEEHVENALKQRKQRISLFAQEHHRAVGLGQVRIEVQGQVVGQVTGLTVVEAAGEQFGEPTRITALTHIGDGEVVDIERKAEMAGNIHAKSNLILSGYLRSLLTSDLPLPFSTSLAFEQSYYEIDGDSAGLAELAALLSSLSGSPVDQSFAITGAIDQLGNVLAVGGVNEKIEGFYRIASELSEQPVSVVFPASNLPQLNLLPDVCDAVAGGQLRLFAVEHVAEAVALITGKPMGEPDPQGDYPQDSILGLIQRRIDRVSSQEDSSIWRFFRR